MGDSPKWVKSRRRRKKEEEKNTPGTASGPGGRDRTLAVKSKNEPNDGNYNGQATHGARKPPGPIILNQILQGLRVAQAAVTERWP